MEKVTFAIQKGLIISLKGGKIEPTLLLRNEDQLDVLYKISIVAKINNLG